MIGIALIWALTRYAYDKAGERGRIDLVGALTSTLAISLLLLGIERSATVGITETWTLVSLVLSVILLVVFITVQAKVKVPLMPLHLFASFERYSAYLSRTLFLGANMGFYYSISQYLQDVLGMNAAYAGVAFLPRRSSTSPRQWQCPGSSIATAMSLC